MQAVQNCVVVLGWGEYLCVMFSKLMEQQAFTSMTVHTIGSSDVASTKYLTEIMFFVI